MTKITIKQIKINKHGERKMQEVTLKKAVEKMCGTKKCYQLLKYYLKRSLRNTGTQKLILREADAIEIQDGFVTISFTWDMISAVNNITHKSTDLCIPETAFEVFD